MLIFITILVQSFVLFNVQFPGFKFVGIQKVKLYCNGWCPKSAIAWTAPVHSMMVWKRIFLRILTPVEGWSDVAITSTNFTIKITIKITNNIIIVTCRRVIGSLGARCTAVQSDWDRSTWAPHCAIVFDQLPHSPHLYGTLNPFGSTLFWKAACINRELLS